MQEPKPLTIALGGLIAMAAAMGIGRFVYTPILPAMLEALSWSKADAGLVASANFLGYFLGALIAGHRSIAARPRFWLLVGLTASAATTLAMALPTAIAPMLALRFLSGIASAFVIVCSSTLVLARLAGAGRPGLSAVHFAGVGAGIMVSAAVVSAMLASGAGWRGLWIATGVAATVGAAIAAWLIPGAAAPSAAQAQAGKTAVPSAPAGRLAGMVTAYGLFGFGYVITATFLVAIVRQTPEIRPLEPWIWLLFGAAAVPSVALWVRLGQGLGLVRAFAIAAVVEAVGVAASVEWVSVAGVVLSAVLLGGTFMGLTALGLMIARQMSSDAPQRAVGRMTASFGLGQMIGPVLAGYLFEATGSFRAASLVAVAALLLAAGLAVGVGRSVSR